MVTNTKTNQQYSHVTKYMAEKVSGIPMSFIDMILEKKVSSKLIGNWKFEYVTEATEVFST